jgi:hypothetical protein
LDHKRRSRCRFIIVYHNGNYSIQTRVVEALEFVRKIPSHKHIAFLYSNENSNADILAAFFDTKITGKATKGLLSSNKPTNGEEKLTILLVLAYPDLKVLYSFGVAW